MSRPRVLMVGWGYPPEVFGGLDVAVAETYEELTAMGVDVSLVIPEANAPDEADVVTMETEGDSIVEQVSSIAGDVAARATEFDIVHTHDWFGYEVGFRAKMTADVSWVSTIHSLASDRSRSPSEQQLRHEFMIMRWADEVVAVSDLLADEIESSYGRESRVVHNGFSERRATGRDVKSELGITDPMVLYVGRHAEQKGLSYLVYGFSKLLEERDATLVVGGKGPLTEQLRTFAECLGVGDRVRFVGYIPHERLGDYYESADVFVSPSVSEPFGLSITEALEAGTPVAATESGVGEVLPDDCLVDIKPNSASIERGLTKALDRDAPPEYTPTTWEDCAKAYAALYEEIARDRSEQNTEPVP